MRKKGKRKPVQLNKEFNDLMDEAMILCTRGCSIAMDAIDKRNEVEYRKGKAMMDIANNLMSEVNRLVFPIPQ